MLSRKTPLKRTCFKKKPRGPNRAGSNPEHLRRLRETWMPCCCCGDIRRYPWQIHAHHLILTGKGTGLKTPDDWAIPLCTKCHADLHNFRGYFQTFTKERRAQWQIQMALSYCPESANPALRELLKKYETGPDPWREIF